MLQELKTRKSNTSTIICHWD